MQPQSAGHAHDAASPIKTTSERTFSPLAFALDRLFPKRGNAPYTATERLVVLVIVRAMTLDRSSGDFNCFLSYPTIAKRAGISIASVKRALQKHCDGAAPLLCRSLAGETRGHHHACYRFTLVRHPEQFAAARDAARAERRGKVDRELRDLQPDRLALQREREDFGGTLTDAEYRLRLAALERATRRQIPARAFLKGTTPS
jgi:DNA-binding transcriptional MerR regulator